MSTTLISPASNILHQHSCISIITLHYEDAVVLVFIKELDLFTSLYIEPTVGYVGSIRAKSF